MPSSTKLASLQGDKKKKKSNVIGSTPLSHICPKCLKLPYYTHACHSLQVRHCKGLHVFSRWHLVKDYPSILHAPTFLQTCQPCYSLQRDQTCNHFPTSQQSKSPKFRDNSNLFNILKASAMLPPHFAYMSTGLFTRKT